MRKKIYEKPRVIATILEKEILGAEEISASAWSNMWANSWADGGDGCLRKCIVAF